MSTEATSRIFLVESLAGMKPSRVSEPQEGRRITHGLWRDNLYIDWLTDCWVTEWLTHSMTGRQWLLTDLTDSLTHSLTYSLFLSLSDYRITGSLTGRLTDWLTHSLTHSVTHRFYPCLTIESLAGKLTDFRPTDWPTDWLTFGRLTLTDLLPDFFAWLIN